MGGLGNAALAGVSESARHFQSQRPLLSSTNPTQSSDRYGRPQAAFRRGIHVSSREIDITADFRPKSGLLKGLWLRVRYADAERGPAMADRRDLRLIINYSLKAS